MSNKGRKITIYIQIWFVCQIDLLAKHHHRATKGQKIPHQAAVKINSLTEVHVGRTIKRTAWPSTFTMQNRVTSNTHTYTHTRLTQQQRMCSQEVWVQRRWQQKQAQLLLEKRHVSQVENTKDKFVCMLGINTSLHIFPPRLLVWFILSNFGHLSRSSWFSVCIIVHKLYIYNVPYAHCSYSILNMLIL